MWKSLYLQNSLRELMSKMLIANPHFVRYSSIVVCVYVHVVIICMLLFLEHCKINDQMHSPE